MTTELRIPPCPIRQSDGSNWPRHRAKARTKTFNRSRVAAALEAGRRAADDPRLV